MKKVLVSSIVVALLIAMMVPLVFGEDAPIPGSGLLTADQQAKLVDIRVKMMELRKEMIDVYVESGFVTVEQAQLMKKQVDLQIEYVKTNGVGMQSQYGPGGGRGAWGGFRGGSMRRGGGWGPGSGCFGMGW